MKRNITQEKLAEVLHYDPDTGHLTWKITIPGRTALGAIAGYTDRRGCIDIRIDGVLYKAHRLIWLYVYGCWPVEEVDHIDGDPSNNRLPNLRECSHAQNLQNRRCNKNNTSGLMGVTFYKRDKRWRAQITISGKNEVLGSFESPESAYYAYLKAKSELHPFSPTPRQSPTSIVLTCQQV